MQIEYECLSQGFLLSLNALVIMLKMFVQTHSLNTLCRQLTNQGMSEQYVTASFQPLNNKNFDKKQFLKCCAHGYLVYLVQSIVFCQYL